MLQSTSGGGGGCLPGPGGVSAWSGGMSGPGGVLLRGGSVWSGGFCSGGVSAWSGGVCLVPGGVGWCLVWGGVLLPGGGGIPACTEADPLSPCEQNE